MDLGLDGKTVLVTGGSKGIGLACARLFVSEGARVAITSRSAEHHRKSLNTSLALRSVRRAATKPSDRAQNPPP